MAEFVKRGFRDVPQEIKSLFPAYFFHVEKSVLSGSLLDVQDDRFIKKAIKAIRKEAAQRKDAELKRAIKIASKRIESVDVEYADTLFSIFVQKRCWRSSRIRTRVEEDVDMPEFKESPLNIDFPENQMSLNPLDFALLAWSIRIEMMNHMFAAGTAMDQVRLNVSTVKEQEESSLSTVITPQEKRGSRRETVLNVTVAAGPRVQNAMERGALPFLHASILS